MALKAGSGFYLDDMGPGGDPQQNDYERFEEIGRLLREEANIEMFKTEKYIEDIGFRIRFKVKRDTYFNAYLKSDLNNVYELLKDGRKNYKVYINGFPISEMDTRFTKVKKGDEILIAPVWKVSELPPILKHLEERLFSEEFFDFHNLAEVDNDFRTVEQSIERTLELGFSKEEINAFHEFCSRLTNKYRTQVEWEASGEKRSPYILLITIFASEIINLIKECEPNFEPFLIEEGNENFRNLKSLEILELAYNKMKEIPESIGDLFLCVF